MRLTVEEAAIRRAMKSAGIKNQQELAALIGISNQTIRRRFRRPDSFTLGELRLICDKTGLSLSEFIGGKDAL